MPHYVSFRFLISKPAAALDSLRDGCESAPSPASKLIAIYVDADACPVKKEIYRVAERHGRKGVALKVLVVSNSPIAVPRDPMIERVVVGGGMDAADNWIAERGGPRATS